MFSICYVDKRLGLKVVNGQLDDLGTFIDT